VPVQVSWIFSLPRSGSSITAYAAAAPWGHCIADEVFGPWDRTGPPYYYPRLQLDLMNAYAAAKWHMTPEVVAIANELFEILGGPTGKVVCKHPHLRPSPEEFRAAFPGHRALWLIRNPLRRLNSLYARAWTAVLRPNHELEHFKSFARHWAAEPGRLAFESMKPDPRRYFKKVYRAWGWWHEPANLDAAVAYAANNYHESSAVLSSAAAARPVSERAWHAPDEAVEIYLADPEVSRLARRLGWSVRPADYLSHAPHAGVLHSPGGGAPLPAAIQPAR
jgi:hypothetical protein